MESQRVMRQRILLVTKLFLLPRSLWSLGVKLKPKVFIFFQILFGGVTYVLQVGQRLRRSPEAVVAIPNEDQDKTEEPEAQIEEQIRSSSILYLFGGF